VNYHWVKSQISVGDYLINWNKSLGECTGSLGLNPFNLTAKIFDSILFNYGFIVVPGQF
jgi:hypothetical protein